MSGYTHYTMEQVEAVLAGSAHLDKLQRHIKRFMEILIGIVNNCLGDTQKMQGQTIPTGDPDYEAAIHWEVRDHSLQVYLMLGDPPLRKTWNLNDHSFPRDELVRVYKTLPLLVTSITRSLGDRVVSMCSLEMMIRNELGFFEKVAAEKL